VYDEMDEEILARIREKVEALREGRCKEVKCTEQNISIGKENHYVIQMVPDHQAIFSKNSSSRKEELKSESHYEELQTSRVQYPSTSGGKLDSNLDEDHYEVLFHLPTMTQIESQQKTIKTEVMIAQHSFKSPSPSNTLAGHPYSEEKQYETIFMEK
ncbi:hypothetical protein SK128_025578, partial [Halocaridina rubra]